MAVATTFHGVLEGTQSRHHPKRALNNINAEAASPSTNPPGFIGPPAIKLDIVRVAVTNSHSKLFKQIGAVGLQ